MNTPQVLLTGVKPTGDLHLGNYFGAIKPFFDLFEKDSFDETYLFIANYHALNSRPYPEELRERTFGIARDYLALGLDPNKVTMFRQSDVPEHTELTWILMNLLTVAYLERSHAYKDAIQSGKEANMGLFAYPVLMASDILLYQSTHVPVGQDQKQHLEIAQEIVRKFHNEYYYKESFINKTRDSQGNVIGLSQEDTKSDDTLGRMKEKKDLNQSHVFTNPQCLITEGVGTVPGTDGRKMSKSYDNTIKLFADEKEIKKSIMGIVTDSLRPEDPKDPDTNNIFQIHQLLLDEQGRIDLRAKYQDSGLGYGDAKKALLGDYLEYFSKARERQVYYQNRPDELEEILQEHAKKARTKARATLERVREAVGL
jgi:tryptophanyl-tRNA synthetase